MRPRGVLGLNRAFVGRDEQMNLLDQTFDEVSLSGQPRLVTILGDAGVGKTRLLREFWERLGERSPEPLRRTGRCLSYGEGVTYWPLAEILREQLRISESDPSGTVLEQLGTRPILGLALGLDVGRDLHPLAARDRFQDAWVEFVQGMTSERPLVMLVEDIHWGEDLLLDLLERLVADARSPLLLVATARPELLESRPGWGSRLPGTSVTLEALPPDDTGLMLDELLGGSLPRGLREVVVARAEGNPFFVEELLGTLIDLKLLVRDGAAWRLVGLPADFAVPDTIQAVVAARVDLLEAADKQGLQAASVIGRIFWAGPVYELVTEGYPNLRVLEERDFVRRRSSSSISGDREYAIKHAVTREVAYESLPKARRAHMHAAFARWLEGNGLGRDEFASLLAHHYAQAVRPDDADLAWMDRAAELAALRDRAIEWLHHAAALAMGRMEIDDALVLLHRAIELESRPEQLSDLWHAVGRANILKFDGEAFWTAMQASLDATSDKSRAAEVYADLGFQTSLRAGMWKRKPDPQLVAGWTDRALDLADRASPARAKSLLARVNEHPAGSEQAAQEALDIADAVDDVELRSFAFEALSSIAMTGGDYDAASDWAQRRVDLVPELSDPDHISLIYGFTADSFIGAGRFDDARRNAVAYDAVARRLSPHHRLHAAHVLVEVDALAGRWEAVRALMPRAESAVTANADTPCVLEDVVLLWCALSNVYLGANDEAKRLERVVAGLGREGYGYRFPIDVEIAVARDDRTALERILSDWAPAGLSDLRGLVARLDALVKLERRADIEADAPKLRIPGSYLEPFALRSLGWARVDTQMIKSAIDRFVGMGMPWHAEQTKSIGSGMPTTPQV